MCVCKKFYQRENSRDLQPKAKTTTEKKEIQKNAPKIQKNNQKVR